TSMQHFYATTEALISAITTAVFLFAIEQVCPFFSATLILFYASGFGAILAFVLVVNQHQALFPQSLLGWLLVTALAVCGQILGWGFVAYALKTLPATFVAGFLLLDPVFAALGAHLFLAEQLSQMEWLGFIFILVGVLLMTLELPDSTDSSLNLQSS
ncbi:MAG: DMT family transporter, partial [Cyanobacteria bacterium P01_H01_bin.121]